MSTTDTTTLINTTLTKKNNMNQELVKKLLFTEEGPKHLKNQVHLLLVDYLWNQWEKNPSEHLKVLLELAGEIPHLPRCK
jgi:hypothetical protein